MGNSFPGPRTQVVMGVLSAAFALVVLHLFILCCWSAAADAQGAVAFFFALPLFGLGLIVSFALAWIARRRRFGRVVLGGPVALALFLVLFYAGGRMPGLQRFPGGVIHLVAEVYKGLTGKSPYQADKGL